MNTLTLSDVCRILKLSPRTIKRHAAARLIPTPLQVGHRLRWREADIQQFLSPGVAQPSLVDTAIPATVSSTPMPIITPEVF